MRNSHHTARTYLGKACAPCGRAGPGSATPIGLGAGQAGVCSPSLFPARSTCSMSFLHSLVPSWVALQDLLPPWEKVGTHPHTENPQPGQQQSLAASNGSNCSLARAIPVESLAALVLPRLFFHAIISCLSDPLPARWPPGTAVADLSGRDSQGMEMGEVPVSALQGQTWAC